MQTFLSHVWVCTQAHISHTCRSCRIHFSWISHSCFLVLTDLAISYLLSGSHGLALRHLIGPTHLNCPSKSALSVGPGDSNSSLVHCLYFVPRQRRGEGSQCLLYENISSLFVPLLDAHIQSALVELSPSSPHTPIAPYIACSSGWPFPYCPAWGSHSPGYGNLYWTFFLKSRVCVTEIMVV